MGPGQKRMHLNLGIPFHSGRRLTLSVPLGMRSSYASQHSQLGQDLRSAMSPDRHITPIYEDRAFHGPLYRSPSHQGPVDLNHASQSAIYRGPSGTVTT